MVTLFASIAGFIGSLIPEILKLIKDCYDKKHQLNIIDLEIKNHEFKRSDSNKIITKQCELAQQNSLYSTYNSGIRWIDALNASVRPILAYSFFLMYAWVKYVQYRAIDKLYILSEYLNILWSIDDQAIFAGIISFYFGQRTFNKLWKLKS